MLRRRPPWWKRNSKQSNTTKVSPDSKIPIVIKSDFRSFGLVSPTLSHEQSRSQGVEIKGSTKNNYGDRDVEKKQKAFKPLSRCESEKYGSHENNAMVPPITDIDMSPGCHSSDIDENQEFWLISSTADCSDDSTDDSSVVDDKGGIGIGKSHSPVHSDKIEVPDSKVSIGESTTSGDICADITANILESTPPDHQTSSGNSKSINNAEDMLSSSDSSSDVPFKSLSIGSFLSNLRASMSLNQDSTILHAVNTARSPDRPRLNENRKDKSKPVDDMVIFKETGRFSSESSTKLSKRTSSRDRIHTSDSEGRKKVSENKSAYHRRAGLMRNENYSSVFPRSRGSNLFNHPSKSRPKPITININLAGRFEEDPVNNDDYVQDSKEVKLLSDLKSEDLAFDKKPVDNKLEKGLLKSISKLDDPSLSGIEKDHFNLISEKEKNCRERKSSRSSSENYHGYNHRGSPSKKSRICSPPEMKEHIGLIKIKATQKQSFIQNYIERFYLDRSGDIAKGMKPILMFHVENPKFKSEFIQKKEELYSYFLNPARERNLKEKFAFKIKIGLEYLDEFVKEGLKVSEQDRFFGQINSVSKTSKRNSVLLYRNSDVCLGWVRCKKIEPDTPVFLLICKVVYGRTLTLSTLRDTQHVKPNHDTVGVSLAIMETVTKDHIERVVKSLSCSKVLIADHPKDSREDRDRPRQILPFAIAVYVPEHFTEAEEAHVKQIVFKWKARNFDNSFILNNVGKEKSDRKSVFSRLRPHSKNDSCGGSVSKSSSDTSTGELRDFKNKEKHKLVQSGLSYKVEDVVVLKQERSVSKEPVSPMKKKPRTSSPRSSETSITNKEVPETKTETFDNRINLSATFKQDASTTTDFIEKLDAEVQVKMTSIISMQQKSHVLSTSTQTPNLETDDSYEAMLLRGGIVAKPKTPLFPCFNKTTVKAEPKTVGEVKLYINANGRERLFATLCDRFESYKRQPLNDSS